LLYNGTQLVESVASRPDARVVHVDADGQGGVLERPQPVRLLPGATAGQARREPYGVSELRALRAGRNRWD
jgi:hypothetical protein